MILAIDYDDTWTRDWLFWDSFIRSAQRRGHTVYCVTWRDPTQPVHTDLSNLVQVFYTSLQAKRVYMEAQNILVDIWLDDNPWSVDNNHTDFYNF